MSILFLHISDLHLKSMAGVNRFQVQKMADTVRTCGAFDEFIIIVTGDIAHSGKTHQYDAAYRCVGSIIAEVKNKCGSDTRFHVLCVPGNHDVDHGDSTLTTEDLQNARQKRLYEQHLSVELGKQKAFFDFANRNRCFAYDRVLCQKMIDVNGFTIEANLINSALFSTMGEDKGLHYIPQHCLNRLNAPTGAALAITVMHHAPDWYLDNQKTLLEIAIYGKSSLVFCGHEHYIAEKQLSYEKSALVLIQAGGCLCQDDDWTHSEYHLGILETDSMLYSLSKFRWNSTERQYEVVDKREQRLAKKPSKQKHFTVSPEYASSLIQDMKQHNVSKDFRDYFVFPRIQIENQDGSNGKEYVDIDAFADEILSRGRVLITGGHNCGKSALLRSLFFHFSDDYAVIFCSTDDIRGKRADRIVRNRFEDIYGDNPSDYDRFLQLPKEKRILIIDDIDMIQRSSFEYFTLQLTETFGHFIFASKQVLDLDLLSRMKPLLQAEDSVYRYRIAPFYTDKRNELVRKVVGILAEDKSSIEATSTQLSEAIRAQRRFISLDPDFIIQYVEYYCRNIGEAIGNDSGVFSKVFEANLIGAISECKTGILSVDKIFVLLSKIAYHIHFSKAYPIPRAKALAIIEEYNIDYGGEVNGSEALDIMTNSRVLLSANGEGYRFASKSYLAFFVAREVNHRYHETHDDTDLQKLLQCSCFGINSDILLFLSYIADNIRILRLIVHMAQKYTGNWDEFGFGDSMPKFLKIDRRHILELPASNERQKVTEAEIETERLNNTELNTIDIYDYSDDDAEKSINQIIRACSLLIVVSRCLPNFEHAMRKVDKDAFVDVIYRLPNRIFQLWADQVDKDTDEILRYLKEQSQDFYNRQKGVSDDDILRALQWGAMSLLLELYGLAVFHSTKSNTAMYLAQFDWRSKDTYSIEHLMMLARQNSSLDFADTAVSMSDPKKGHLYMTMLRRVVHHALVFMDSLNFKLQQRLQTKFFPSKSKRGELMMQRLKSNRVNE